MDDLQISASSKVSTCPKTGIGSQWPFPVERRMRDLVTIANDAGLRTSKQELLAALVCSVLADESELERALRRYRTATAGEVTIGLADAENVVRMERRGPGRRAGGP